MRQLRTGMNANHLLVAFVTLFFYSCSGEEDPSPETTCVVEFTAPAVNITTRASDPLPTGDEVAVSAYEITGDTESISFRQSKRYAVSDALGTLISLDGDNMRLSYNSSYMFYAYSPALPFANGSGKTISITNGTDFKLTNTQAAITGNLQTINLPGMDHMCSYVKFSVVRDAANTQIQNISIGDNGLVLKNITHSPVDYTLGDGPIKLAGIALDGTLTLPQSAFSTVRDGNEYTGGVAVLPKTDSPFTLILDIYLDNVRSSATMTVPQMPFLPGKYYTFTIRFLDARAILAFTADDWTILNSEVELGGGA